MFEKRREQIHEERNSNPEAKSIISSYRESIEYHD